MSKEPKKDYNLLGQKRKKQQQQQTKQNKALTM